jgi:hypothetical protein
MRIVSAGRISDCIAAGLPYSPSPRMASIAMASVTSVPVTVMVPVASMSVVVASLCARRNRAKYRPGPDLSVSGFVLKTFWSKYLVTPAS